MRRLSAAVLSVLALAFSAAPAGANTTLVSVLGSGDYQAGCVTVVGARTAWLFAFYPGVAAETPAGTCPEDRPHYEPRSVSCVMVEVEEGRTTAYLAGRVTGGQTLVAKVVDGVTDEVAAALIASPEADRCGAGNLATQPVRTGSFTIAAV